MKKVHIIGMDNLANFEKAINDFIKDVEVIDIKYQTVTYPKQIDKNGAIMSTGVADRALIIYEDKEPVLDVVKVPEKMLTGEVINTLGYCPACGIFVGNVEDEDRNFYCPKCGQALEWGD